MSNAEFVREARARLDMTQEELGKKIGLSRWTVRRYERGAWEVPTAVALAIRHLLEGHKKGGSPSRAARVSGKR